MYATIVNKVEFSEILFISDSIVDYGLYFEDRDLDLFRFSFFADNLFVEELLEDQIFYVSDIWCRFFFKFPL